MSKNKEEQKPQTTSFESMSSSRIDLVKELIFGEDLAQTREKLQELESRLETASESITDRFETRLSELEARVTARINALEEWTRQEIERLSTEKTDRRALGKMLEELGKNLQEN